MLYSLLWNGWWRAVFIFFNKTFLQTLICHIRISVLQIQRKSLVMSLNGWKGFSAPDVNSVSQSPREKPGWHCLLFILPLRSFLRTSQNLFPQDIQSVNNYSSKKVSTVFERYFKSLHQRGIWNGKTVGEESRMW